MTESVDIVKTLAQLGATGVLAVMWWVARQDIAAARKAADEAQALANATLKARADEQADLLKLALSGRKESDHD